MTGRRRYPDEDGHINLGLGDYLFDPRSGIWYCCAPRLKPDGCKFVGNLAKHTVVEHEDGTITVSPSILITWRGAAGEVQWHGFLERGVWREV